MMRHPPPVMSSLSVSLLPWIAPLTLPSALLVFCTPTLMVSASDAAQLDLRWGSL
jgi:hypothetical protein